jgi:hypothetical protein
LFDLKEKEKEKAEEKFGLLVTVYFTSWISVYSLSNAI